MKELIKRYPIAAFFILTFCYSWFGGAVILSGLLPRFGEWPLIYDGQVIEKVRLWRTLLIWGPNFAAVTVLGISEGRNSIRNLFSGFLKWKVGCKWWCASIFVPLGLAFASVMLHSSLGRNLDLSYLTALPTIFFLLLLQSVTESGIGEEAGWRGFALPALQANHGALVSSLIVGIVWAFWHAPLFFVLNYSFSQMISFIGMIICLSVIYTWIFNGSQGSLLLVAIIHNLGNTIDATLSTRGPKYGALLSEQDLSNVFIPLLVGFTVMVVILTKGQLGLKTNSDQ